MICTYIHILICNAGDYLEFYWKSFSVDCNIWFRNKWKLGWDFFFAVSKCLVVECFVSSALCVRVWGGRGGGGDKEGNVFSFVPDMSRILQNEFRRIFTFSNPIDVFHIYVWGENVLVYPRKRLSLCVGALYVLEIYNFMRSVFGVLGGVC